MYLDVTPSLILGPVCSYAAHGVNEFAKFWNIPMITSGAMAMAFTQEFQPTLTRITAPYTEIGEFYKVNPNAPVVKTQVFPKFNFGIFVFNKMSNFLLKKYDKSQHVTILGRTN